MKALIKDLNTQQEKFIKNIMLALKQWYHDSMSENIKRGIAAKKLNK